MTIVLFVSLFFILLSIVEKLVLGPIETGSTLYLPGWLGSIAIVLLFTWLLGD